MKNDKGVVGLSRLRKLPGHRARRGTFFRALLCSLLSTDGSSMMKLGGVMMEGVDELLPQSLEWSLNSGRKGEKASGGISRGRFSGIVKVGGLDCRFKACTCRKLLL